MKLEVGKGMKRVIFTVFVLLFVNVIVLLQLSIISTIEGVKEFIFSFLGVSILIFGNFLFFMAQYKHQ